MGELDNDGGVEHLGHGAITELGAQQREQRTQPLPTGVDQVPGGGTGQDVGVGDRLLEPVLDRGEPAAETFGEVRVRPGEGCCGGHGMNRAASVSAPSTGPGITPSRTVPIAAMATATPVYPSPASTTVDSPGVPSASVKNISTTRRT